MKLLIVLSFLFVGLQASAKAPQNGNFRCKNFGDYVCAQNLSTGQCTHSWDREDGGNPMFFCKKYIGLKVSNFDRNNYACKKTSSGYCAVNKRTGQCTHEWYTEEGGNPKFFCNKFIGKKVSNFDKSNYTCKRTNNGYCAMNKRTGQCGHVWNRDDHPNPKFSCNSWLRK